MKRRTHIPNFCRAFTDIKLILTVVAILAVPGLALAGNKYWVGGGGNTNSPGNGTWTTTTPTVWSDGTVSTADAGWAAGDAAFFGGADGVYGVKVGGAISMTGMNFLASGYTLSNNTPVTITGTSTSGLITVAAGKTNVIGTNVTVAIGSSSPAAIGAPSGVVGGTLIINNGGLVEQTANRGLNVSGAAGTVVSVGPGGTLEQANTQAGSSYMMVGYKVGDAPTLSVDGGTVIVARTTQSLDVPAPSGVAAFGDVEGTLTVNSGSVLPGSAAGIVLAQEPLNTGTLNLNGGVITVASGVTKGGTAMGDSTGIAHFNGGVLKATQNQATFIDGLDWADIRNGGLVVSNNGFSLTVGQILSHSTNALDNAIDGGVINLSSGTLTLLPDNSGLNTYTGPTIVSNGTVVISTANIGGGACYVNKGATLTVQVNNPGTSLTNSDITLGNSGSATVNFALGGNASATVPAVIATGSLKLNGTVTVNVTGSLTGPSTNVLISYGSVSGTGSLVAGSIPTISGCIASLINDTVNHQLVLVYNLPGQPVQWAVGNGNWDTTSSNWQPLGGGVATVYSESDPVTFDDNATGSSPITVTLTGDHAPGDITENAAKEYIITGPNAIIAGGTLTKNNSGTLVWAVNSSHAGGTVINGGILQVGNGGATGSLGSGPIANGSGLAFNLTSTLTVPGIISGSGSVTNNGGGTINLTGTNTYNGITVINAGTLSTALTSTGAGDYLVANGATFGVTANTPGSLPIGQLTLGTAAGSLTNGYQLGSLTSNTNPLVAVNGLNLNGTVTVNVSGVGLVTGTYVLLQYSSLSGGGKFVPGTLPAGWFIFHDPAAKQLKLVGVSGLVWDAGNTSNGSIIDAASGTWDTAATNLVWNNNGVNVAFANGNSVIFGGQGGNYDITLGAAVTTPAIEFANSGYALTAATPQTISLSGATGTLQVYLDPGTTNTIGTNVMVQNNGSLTYLIGQSGSTAGGTLNIVNGGSVVQNGNGRTLAESGLGTVINVYAGGVFSQTSTGAGNCQIGIGSILNVEGGTMADYSPAAGSIIAVGSATGASLNVNSGTVSSVGTSGSLRLTTSPGDIGTINLNGGITIVPKIYKGGDATATATVNFNGGILQAAAGGAFLTGLDAANVLTNGAVIDDGGNIISITQNLLGGANPDGGLTKLGSGTLTLGGVNTYNGSTTVSNGILVIAGGASINNSTAVELTAGAMLDVSAVAPFDIIGSHTLGGGGLVIGSVQVEGTLAPVGTLAFNNDLTLNGNLVFSLNKSLTQPNDLVAVSGTLAHSSTGTLTVSNAGPGLVAGDKFTLFNQPVPNGNQYTLVPPSGVTFTNNLAVDGSITVLTAPDVIASNPTNISVAVSGSVMTLSWPADHLGWIAQSNSVDLINSNAWYDIANSQSGTNLLITINPATGSVFYRLRKP
ncbi:MAG TPA: autotransporter-associated beta strand repeat-containing protein [Verrucomicrobiae bacterium]